MLIKLVPCSLLVLLLGACDPRPEGTSYIDSRAFFTEQAQQMQDNHTALHKKAMFDGKQEETDDTNPDWQKELSPFSDIDMRKPSLAGRYAVDTSVVSDSTYEISYMATDTATTLRNIVFGFHNDHISYVQATYTEKNTLYETRKDLVYTTGKGYSITGDQQVTLGSPVRYSIEASFSTR
jgi:hypothetical protein